MQCQRCWLEKGFSTVSGDLINIIIWCVLSIILCMVVYKKETNGLKTEPKRSVFSFFNHFLGNFTIPIHIFTDFVEK